MLLLAACANPGYNRADGRSAVTPQVFDHARGRYDTPPKLVDGNTPFYPPEQRLSGRPGKVTVTFTIGVDGRASGIEVRDASEKPFGDTMIDAVRT